MSNSNEWIAKATKFLALKEYRKAIECCEKAVAIDRNFVLGWNIMGNAYVNLGENDKAIECCEKAIAIDPNFVLAWNNMGNAYDDLKNYDKAIECYEKAVTIDLNYADAWNNMGVTYFRLKEHQKAIECYEKALEIDSKNTNAWRNMEVAYNAKNDSRNALRARNRDPSLLAEINTMIKAKKENKEREEKEIRTKLEKMFKVSNRIKFEMMRDALKIEEHLFNELIFEWADKFNFTIDGDYLIVNKETVDDFIQALDKQFKSWESKERNKFGKIE